MAKNKILGKFLPIQLATYVGVSLPLALMLRDYFTNNLSVNPIQELTQRTGNTALILLMLSFAVTPMNTIFGWRQPLKVRRALGVWAFVYVSIHLLIFTVLDYTLRWDLIKEAIFEKPYALVGFSAFLILVPIAITSTKGWQKRLRKVWSNIHKGTYIATPLAVIHFTWATKADLAARPLFFGIAVILLLIVRIPVVRRATRNVQYKIAANRHKRNSPTMG